jgi:hypothetical protein
MADDDKDSPEVAKKQLEEPCRFVFGKATHGTMESLLALTCTGAFVRFYELQRKTPARVSMDAVPLWGITGQHALDMRKPGDRVRMVGLAVRLFRLMRGLVEFHAPTQNFNATKHAQEKGTDPVILMTPFYVDKYLGPSIPAIEQGMGSVDELQKLYDAVRDKEKGTRFIVHATLDVTKLVTSTFDVGFRRIPRTVEEARLAMRCVLEALEWLHGHGVVHRDVRWPNVLKTDVDRFMLIDLELCARIDRAKGMAPWPERTMLREEFWPERETDKDGWSPRHDLLQMVKMLWTPPPEAPDVDVVASGAAGSASGTGAAATRRGRRGKVEVPQNVLEDVVIQRVVTLIRKDKNVTAGDALKVMKAMQQ